MRQLFGSGSRAFAQLPHELRREVTCGFLFTHHRDSGRLLFYAEGAYEAGHTAAWLAGGQQVREFGT